MMITSRQICAKMTAPWRFVELSAREHRGPSSICPETAQILWSSWGPPCG